MSENQQPLTEEQASEAQAASAAEEETAQTVQPAAAADPLPADETDDDVQADAEDTGEVEDEEDRPPKRRRANSLPALPTEVSHPYEIQRSC